MGAESVDKARRQAAATLSARHKFQFGAAFLILLLYSLAHLVAHSSSGGSSTAMERQRPYAPSRAAAAGTQWQPAGAEQPQPSSQDATLSFLVCNGFANQRIAILSGVVLAAALNRTLVLPHLLLDGTQQSEMSVTEDAGAQHVEFREMFDQAAFASGLERLGVRVTTAAPPVEHTIHLSMQGMSMDALRSISLLNSQKHLRLDCPALRVEAQLMARNEALVFAALQALQPARPLRDIVDRAEAALQRLSPTQAFNVLHLRAEEDWVQHCARWEHKQDGLVRDNCLNNTEAVGDSLAFHGIDAEVPLLVLTDWTHASPSLTQQALSSLKSNGYAVVRRHELFPQEDSPPALPRELAALVDYHLALRSSQFIGNSVSSFTAMLILERRHQGRFGAYYNGGNIPLEGALPLFRMPWVFTYNDWSAGTEYDYMVMAAVTSAIYIGRVQPYCLYSGSKLSQAYKWLTRENVTIIEHEPTWRDAVAREAARNKDTNAKHFSHLYQSPGQVVGTFQRIDIPVLPQLLQYEFVLFTDCDVYFRQRIALVDWGTPLPQAVGMSFETSNAFPYNAGVMLYNMSHMRRTYPAFLEWILSQRNGHHYGQFGPLDQGAINMFYAEQLINKPTSQVFNAKTYHPFNPQARIVHFHGPKPNDYVQWRLTGKCRFNDLCRQGFAAGLCRYAAEYYTIVPEWLEAGRLVRLCRGAAG